MSEANGKKCSNFQKVIWLLTIVTLSLVTSLGRLELGLNSVGDLIFGTVMGLILVCISHLIIKDPVMNHVSALFQGKTANPLPIKRFMILWSTVLLAALGVSLLLAFLFVR